MFSGERPQIHETLEIFVYRWCNKALFCLRGKLAGEIQEICSPTIERVSRATLFSMKG